MTAEQMYRDYLIACGRDPWATITRSGFDASTPFHSLPVDQRQFWEKREADHKEALRQRDAHRASLNRIADRLHVVHEDPKIEDAVAALERELYELKAKSKKRSRNG